MSKLQLALVGRTLLVLGLLAAAKAEADQIDLAGSWQVCLDPKRRFDEPPDEGYQPVQLPGALRDSGLGEPVGPHTRWVGSAKKNVWDRPEYRRYQNPESFKVPFWLQPERHFVGPAYYRRTVMIPWDWEEKQILLTLERPHWRTRVWVDETAIGEDDSLSTPHVYDLTEHLSAGKHTLTIRVDNSLQPLDVGINSHSVSDHTQSAWHGIVGQLELRAEPICSLQHVDVRPGTDAKSCLVTVRATNTGRPKMAELTLELQQHGQVLGTRTFDVTVPVNGMKQDFELELDRKAARWDEFEPNLCTLTAKLHSPVMNDSEKQATFGFRHIETKGTQFVLNGRPLFLRGTLECCIFPLTGYPPTDVAYWKKIVRVCKAHGLNHIRFHSWCPPEAAFVAADELGFYYQVECATWPNYSTSLGTGKPIDQWLHRERDRIQRAYGNHPSFLLLAMGNEPAGPQRGGKYLTEWLEQIKSREDRFLITGGSSWPQIPANEFHVTPAPRIHQWGAGLRSRINARPPETTTDYREIVQRYEVPVVGHEIGQWCVYPNFAEMKKYTGSLKPRNFEIFEQLLKEARMGDQAHDFLMASGKLQALCYKEEVESSLRTPGYGGFQLLDLHDFPGQGTALVGVLDPFWDSKPYISPTEFSRFCGPTVPLARMEKRVWTNDETLVAEIDVSHFGPQPLDGATVEWSLSDIAKGSLAPLSVETGELKRAGRIEVPLKTVSKPRRLKLKVALASRSYENDWDLWVYPVPAKPERSAENVMVADSLTDDAENHLARGGTVVLLAAPGKVASGVQLGFSSIFWNTAWTNDQPPHTLGILCDPDHPVFTNFPTDYHSDWQWWDIVHRARPMELDQLPPQLRPLIQVVPDWFKPQRLGLLFEARVGTGKLLVCSVDLSTGLENRPVARQLRHSLLNYAVSDDFSPRVSVDLANIHKLFHNPE